MYLNPKKILRFLNVYIFVCLSVLSEHKNFWRSLRIKTKFGLYL